MPETISAEELNRAFLAAIDASVSEHNDVESKPLELELEPSLSLNLRAHLYALKRYERDDDRFRIQPTSGPDSEELSDEAFILLLGYNDNLDGYEDEEFFAIFDPDVYSEEELEAGSPNRLIPEGTIERAAEEGEGIFVKERETEAAEFIHVVQPNFLYRAILERILRILIRDAIEKQISSGWGDSYQSQVSIEQTIFNFLTTTDLAIPVDERYEAAVRTTAKEEYATDVDQETINSEWGTATDQEPASVLDNLESLLFESNPELLREVHNDRILSDEDIFDRVEEHPSTDNLHFPTEDLYQTIDAGLRSGNHLIFIGPPGAGKSHLAEVVADHYAIEYEVTTATSDWTTFDTIGGYREQKDEKLKFRPGLFLQRFLDPDGPIPKNEWLVTDELNRADVDKALGSLFSALTRQNISLPFDTDQGQVKVIGNPENHPNQPLTDHHYYIPQDWRMIATMNTDDKSSLYRLSYAFMRRFAFINIPVPKNETEIRNSMPEYLSAWDIDLEDDITLSEEQLEQLPEDFETRNIREDLADIWSAVQPLRPIGPAMIQDVLEQVMIQLEQGQELDYGSAVAGHVLPQLEGSSDQDIKSIIAGLDDIQSMSMEPIYRFTDKYLGVQVDDEQ